ncbi:hypothetical protein DWQ65_07425 [Treponema phagedenis]|uniref:Uncharacterized protein n=1 Tax=Treponema phagedenis TaxID=162 RepID=A0A0B7GSK8_TREPH|nr:hypothetical protein [Treponema phagedenis]NVP23275.1 hypothetical protein [Treponema phagedenis]QEK06235.1 hypothetical protein FUT80_05615 [Treponema phagedenis]QLC58132.1 hypothetical protein HW453_04430 [Treponema phagedenis]QSH99897.1 hypothetical protein DWQ65_07425 [Treponema phagedenis]CEM60472.1 conserved hypothetical protein [Treponema phagedenis]
MTAEKENITEAIILYIKLLGKTTPCGSTYWERPCILLERIKMYDEAILICQRAVKVTMLPKVRIGDFSARLKRLIERRNRALR